MPLVEIDTIDDPRLEPYRNLKRTNATRWTDSFVAEGDKLVRRLIRSELPILSLLAERRYADEFSRRLPDTVPVYVVDGSLVESIVGFNFHRGVLAHGRRPAPPDLDALLASWQHSATVVVCPELHDPENLGILVRTALALGVDAVLLGPKSVDPFARRVLRTSMGAVFQLPVLRAADLQGEFDKLVAARFQTVATVTDPTALPLDAFVRGPRLAVLFGSEGHGLDAHWIERAQHRVTIPMPTRIDSLNAAVAAGVVLYQFTKRPR